MQEGSNAGRQEGVVHREVLESVVDYLHRLANGEFPDKITEAEIPDDLKPIVRTAALLGFQLEARDRRYEHLLRAARREAKRLAREVGALGAELERRPEPFEATLSAAVRERLVAVAEADVDLVLMGGRADERRAAARIIHRESGRAKGAFVPFASAFAAEAVVEEELFGTVRGRGKAVKLGAFQRADGGTLFVDNVTELGAAAHARLVRFAKNREVVPIGATSAVAVNVRLVCGSPRPLTRPTAGVARVRPDLAGTLGEVVVEVGVAEASADLAAAPIASAANLSEARAEAEMVVIRDALRRSGGNRARAARLLGISREGFRRKLRLYQLST